MVNVRYEWSNERGPTANQDCQRELEDKSIRFLLDEWERGDTVNTNTGKQRQTDGSHGGAYGKLEQVGELSRNTELNRSVLNLHFYN